MRGKSDSNVMYLDLLTVKTDLPAICFVHVARREGKWPALKLCAHPGCRRAFFDFTKSRNGKWCTRRCGDKIRARRARRTRLG